MRTKFLYAIALLVILLLAQQPIESKKVTIHVPYRVKKVKHTHTVYKIVPHHHEYHEKGDLDEDDNYDR